MFFGFSRMVLPREEECELFLFCRGDMMCSNKQRRVDYHPLLFLLLFQFDSDCWFAERGSCSKPVIKTIRRRLNILASEILQYISFESRYFLVRDAEFGLGLYFLCRRKFWKRPKRATQRRALGIHSALCSLCMYLCMYVLNFGFSPRG